MAIRVKSIAFLLALVGCTLISAVAGGETENNHEDGGQTGIKRLRNDIKKVSGEPKKMEEMLNKYERQDDKIDEYTVGQLVELCRESLDKCFYPKLVDITSVGNAYIYEYTFVEIEQYGLYCRQKMANFCLENIEIVTTNLLNSVTEDEKNMAKPFWESVRSAGLIERAHQNAIALSSTKEKSAREELKKEQSNIFAEVLKAYLKYQEQKYGIDPSADNQEIFFFNFLSSMKKYFYIYSLYCETQKKDQSAPNLKDETAIDLFKFGRIADIFYMELSHEYYEELQEKMTREYGCTYNLSSFQFRTQTEEEFLKHRKILEHKAKRILYHVKNIVHERLDCFQ